MTLLHRIPEIDAHQVLDDDLGVGFGSLLFIGFGCSLIVFSFFLLQEEFADVFAIVRFHLSHDFIIDGDVGLGGMMLEVLL